MLCLCLVLVSQGKLGSSLFFTIFWNILIKKGLLILEGLVKFAYEAIWTLCFWKGRLFLFLMVLLWIISKICKSRKHSSKIPIHLSTRWNNYQDFATFVSVVIHLKMYFLFSLMKHFKANRRHHVLSSLCISVCISKKTKDIFLHNQNFINTSNKIKYISLVLSKI